MKRTPFSPLLHSKNTELQQSLPRAGPRIRKTYVFEVSGHKIFLKCHSNDILFRALSPSTASEQNKYTLTSSLCPFFFVNSSYRARTCQSNAFPEDTLYFLVVLSFRACFKKLRGPQGSTLVHSVRRKDTVRTILRRLRRGRRQRRSLLNNYFQKSMPNNYFMTKNIMVKNEKFL